MFWIPLVKEDPPSRQYPHGEGIKGVGDVPWEKFARSSAVWAIFVAQCTQGRIVPPDCKSLLAKQFVRMTVCASKGMQVVACSSLHAGARPPYHVQNYNLPPLVTPLQLPDVKLSGSLATQGSLAAGCCLC